MKKLAPRISLVVWTYSLFLTVFLALSDSGEEWFGSFPMLSHLVCLKVLGIVLSASLCRRPHCRTALILAMLCLLVSWKFYFSQAIGDLHVGHTLASLIRSCVNLRAIITLRSFNALPFYLFTMLSLVFWFYYAASVADREMKCPPDLEQPRLP